MLFKGELASTSDPSIIQFIASEPNSKIIFVGDPAGYEDQIRFYRMIMASPFVPDYQVIEADVNGDMNEFNTKYNLYLSSDPARMYFATIIAALIVGKNILLFFPPEVKGLQYPNALLTHILMNYGIQTRTPEIPFGYNDAYTPNNAALMYHYNVIDPQTYLRLAGETFFGMSDKLAFDLRIPVSDPVIFKSKEMYEYLNSYRLNLLKTDQPLIKPFTREVVSNVSGNRT